VSYTHTRVLSIWNCLTQTMVYRYILLESLNIFIYGKLIYFCGNNIEGTSPATDIRNENYVGRYINPLKTKLVYILFKNPVRTSKRTQGFTITKINWLTLFKFKWDLRFSGRIKCALWFSELWRRVDLWLPPCRKHIYNHLQDYAALQLKRPQLACEAVCWIYRPKRRSLQYGSEHL
jgi:hypothetical protein